MIANLITFAASHPFFSGLAIGALGFGGSFGVICWSLGYEAAMRTVGSWMRPKIDEAPGEVSQLPPVRERRFSSTSYRDRLS